jgi:type IV fimbrial biogenesis protein FimT
MTAKYKQLGFSLVELMITVALIGILTAIAIPSYREWIQNTRIRTTAESIQNGLQNAKAQALRKNARVIFTLANDASWTIGCVTAVAADNDGDGLPDCPAQIESASKAEASNDISISTDSGNMDVTFTNLGIRDPSLAGVEFNRILVDMTSMPAADSRNLDIMVGAGGNIKMCDPNVVAPDLRVC